MPVPIFHIAPYDGNLLCQSDDFFIEVIDIGTPLLIQPAISQ